MTLLKNIPLLGWALGGILMLAALFIVFSSLNPWNPLNYFGRPQTTIDASRDSVVREIQALNRLEAATYSIDKVIEAGSQGNVFQDLLYGDRILLVAHGKVVAGVDMAGVKKEDVQVDGQTLRITLPSTSIFSATLDNEKTTVFDRRTGLLNKGDRNLESQARAAAEGSIRQAACTDGILTEAANNTRNHLSNLFKLFNFTTVEIQVQPGSC
jgi:hypothetical protein